MLTRSRQRRRRHAQRRRFEGIDHAASRLLAFADSIEVLKPARLRRRIAQLAERVTALYG